MSENPITGTYLPAPGGVDPEKIQTVRKRLESYWLALFPDHDLRPGTVQGDLHLRPLSELVAALETAVERFRSDLIPENVANGVIYDCEFVKQYLQGFAVYDTPERKALGIVRLAFNSDEDRVLPGGLRFRFDASPDNEFTMVSTEPGDLLVRKVGEPAPGSGASAGLSENGTVWVVDVLLEGVMETSVLAGSSAATSEAVPGLVSAVAVADFVQGAAENDVPKLAELSRATAYAAGGAVRGGVEALVKLQVPQTGRVRAFAAGDKEMLRASANALGFPVPAMDVYFRGDASFAASTQTLKLRYFPESRTFRGVLNLAQTPMFVDAVNWASLPYEPNRTIYSIPADPATAPGVSCGYSSRETLVIVVEMPFEDGKPMIDVRGNTPAEYHAWFDVTYRFDPLLAAAETVLAGRDYAPAGLDILVRGFNPAVLDVLKIKHVRALGSVAAYDEAAKRIAAYVNTAPLPSQAVIAEIALGCGVRDVVGVEPAGRIFTTAADNVATLDELTFMDEPEVLAANSSPAPELPVAGMASLVPDVVDPSTMAAFTGGTVAVFADAGDIVFEATEV